MKITDEAVQAMLLSWFGDSYEGNHMEEGRAALEAALPHLSQGAVRVKPLEWRTNSASSIWTGDLIFGAYYVIYDENDGYRVFRYQLLSGDGGSEVAFARDQDQAKAAAQADYERQISPALSPAPAGVTPTHRHKKRGTNYVLIGYGKMQAEDWFERTPPHGDPASVDMSEVAVYRSVDDGSLWVRPREDFEDGRFEDLASHEPTPRDNQTDLSSTGDALEPAGDTLGANLGSAPEPEKDGPEVVGWSYEFHDFGAVWGRSFVLNHPDGGANPPAKHFGSPVRNVQPLVRLSALTACQQEVETLREGIKEIAEREQSIRDNWVRHEESTKARILELEADLEIANDKLHRLARVLREARGLLISLDGGRYIHNSRFPEQRIDGDLWDQVSRVAGKARDALGGQSNG